MRRFQPPPLSASLTTPLLQRKCACGKNAGKGAQECSGCAGARVQREALGSAQPAIPDSVQATLRGPGQSLPDATRRFMQQRLGQDFSGVRVHADAAAAASARAVDAAAYTVGSHVVFGAGRYAPQNPAGQRLLAHELTHVMQQRGAAMPAPGELRMDAPDSTAEREADRAAERVHDAGSAPPATRAAGTAQLSRAQAEIPDAASLTMNLGNTPGSGLQFTPAGVTDSVVGFVGAQPGLLQGGISRLNVILGENLTPRLLAVQLLPLWNTATPSTAPGGAPNPRTLLDADELARGLLMYNQFYLGLPGMARWRAGLRLPLPADVNGSVATVNPLQIRALAGSFPAAFEPLLDQRASAPAAAAPAQLAADAAQFLAANTDALGRGIALQARAITNAPAERALIHAVMDQLGNAGFDVALVFMDFLLQPEFQLLAAQRDGVAILGDIRDALAKAPAALTAKQQDSLARANRQMAGLSGTGAAPPQAMRTRAQKTVDIDTVLLDGSNRDPAADVRQADSQLVQCNVRLRHVGKHVATPQQSADWIGAEGELDDAGCGSAREPEKLAREANAAFGLSSRLRAFYVRRVKSARASSCPPGGSAAALGNTTWVGNASDGRTLGHELGHILLDFPLSVNDHSSDTTRLMAISNISPLGETLNDDECTRIHRHA
ncbi:eCIS core domain-containing protein [Tahibacter harae]|uniref:DUF4157 domain-containing protein n=1 Tax=Tahibacter harae TaxID=2963937 RepID=A0ABT1QRI8_9GAMM|nr:DUF4157 domain-containing protein [Tahibacter harae]MCQ4164909.1 DUF4157 domain-containing protein [Tahibacter harae]